MKRILYEIYKYLSLIIIGIGMSLQSDASAAQALSILIEPGITYEYGESSTDYPSPFSNSDGSTQGLGLSGRLAFAVSETLFLGADIRYSYLNFKDPGISYEEIATAYNWGPVIGIALPFMNLRAWGAYILNGEMDPEESEGLDLNFVNAYGYRVGAGLNVENLSFNIEFQNLGYDNTNIEKLGPFATNIDSDSIKYTNQSIIASLSFPFQI